MIESTVIDPRIRVRDSTKLLVRPKIVYVAGIDEASARTFARDVSAAHRTGQPILPIVIDSFGGDCYALFTMIDVLKKATLPIATIIEGKAMSSAAALFCCGTDGYRYVAPNATIMVHDVSTEANGKAEDAKVDAKETDRLNKKMYMLMEDKIGKPRGYLWDIVQKRGRTDWYLTPREAVKIGIANKIGIPTFKIEVSVSMSLE